MKRHEYRYKKIYDEAKDNGYVIISRPDFEALGKLIDTARGDRSLEKFAYITKTAVSTYYRIIQGKRVRPLLISQLRTIYENAISGCGVTMKKLIHANGMAPANEEMIQAHVEKIGEIIDAPEPKQCSQVTRISRQVVDNPSIIYEMYPTAEEGLDKEKVEYDQFLHDLSVYAKDKTPKQLKYLHVNQKRLYENDKILILLKKYINVSIQKTDERISSIRQFYLDNGELLPKDTQTDRIKKELDNMIFGGAL